MLADFASKHRLRKPKADECGDLNIVGKRGDIYDFCDGKFFCCTILDAPNGKHWAKYREAAKAAGCCITQNGDEEGTFLFDPMNESQSRLAIEAIRASRKRTMSQEAVDRLAHARTGTLFQTRKMHFAIPDGESAISTPETLFRPEIREGEGGPA